VNTIANKAYEMPTPDTHHHNAARHAEARRAEARKARQGAMAAIRTAREQGEAEARFYKGGK
jgi:hypothetical protein